MSEIKITILDEDFELDYKLESELSYMDKNNIYVVLYKNGISVGNLEVWTDSETQREYIIINHTIIYLDTLKIAKI